MSGYRALPHSGIALPGRLLGGPDPARMTLHSNAKSPTNRSTRLATKEQRLMCMPMVAVALAQAGH